MVQSSARRWVNDKNKLNFLLHIINIPFSIDDRFVLKEMSKVDVTIFEHFAPKYFKYINKCLLRNDVTILAKIFGVFKVTIKKKT